MRSEGVVDPNITGRESPEACDAASNPCRWMYAWTVPGGFSAVKTLGDVANMFNRTCSVVRCEEPLCVDSG